MLGPGDGHDAAAAERSQRGLIPRIFEHLFSLTQREQQKVCIVVLLIDTIGLTLTTAAWQPTETYMLRLIP